VTKKKSFALMGILIAAGWMLSVSEGLGLDWVAAKIKR
jgi:hypothetical protein